MNEKHRAFREHEVEDYENRRYKGIDQRLVHLREKRMLESLLMKTKPAAGLALDLPCGYGRFTSLLRKAGWSPVSSDYYFHMVRRSMKNDSGAPVRGVTADAKKNLPFGSGSFPLVFSMRFMHHIHKKEERDFIFQEFSRVCSSWAVVSFYQTTLLHLLQRFLRRRLKGRRRRISMLSGREFKMLVENSGFELVRKKPLCKGLHAQHIALLRKIRSGCEAPLSEKFQKDSQPPASDS